MEYTVYAGAGDADTLALGSLSDYGWTKPDLGVTRLDLVKLATAVISASQRAKRDLPVSPESQFIQDVIDKEFGRPKSGPDAATTRPAFQLFSFERHCLEQALLILCQIDPSERAEAFQRDMTVIVGPEFATYGIIFSGPAGGDAIGRNSVTFQARLRCNDLGRLQTASASFASAMNPSKGPGPLRRFSSRGASIGRRLPNFSLFSSDFRRLEIRSVANEKLFVGDAVPVTGRLSLARYSLGRRPARVLLVLSAVFIGASALLFGFFPAESWWMWSEQTMGRLATAAFGALLVDSAIDYTALRKSLMSGNGPLTHGALIDWTRA